MFDAKIRPLIDPILGVAGTRLAAAGLGPNQVTVAGFCMGALAFPALAYQAYGLALVFIALNRIADGLDGAVARVTGASDFGGYLDIVLDFVFYAGVVFFFAVGQPDQALWAAFLIFSFIGSGSSFLAYAIIAAKRGHETRAQGRKSFYYLHGLAEGAETVAALALICLWPSGFFWIAIGFGALCWLTTLGRILSARTAFVEPPVDDPSQPS